MLEWARKVRRFVADVTEDAFLVDERTQSAVIHGLIVVGEIASRVDEDTRSRFPHIPWYEMRGMRNRLAHDYLGIDIDEVWRTVSTDLPILQTQLEEALSLGVSSAEDLPRPVAEVRVGRADLQRAFAFVFNSVKRSERSVCLSFDGTNLKLSRGISSAIVLAEGTWDGTACCAVRSLPNKMMNLSEQIDPVRVRVVDGQLRIGEIAVECSWAAVKPPTPKRR